MVREVPARLPDEQHEVGEEHEGVDSPGLVVGGIHRRRQLVQALDVGLGPRTEQPAPEDPLDRLDHVEVLRRRHAAPRRHHAVGPVELVGQGLEPVAGELARLVGGGLLGVENRGMVELGEGVDEQLPVGTDVGPVLVDLGHLVERIAGDAVPELPEVLAQRRGVVGIEVDEDEALPRLDLDAGQPVVVPVEVEELRLLLDEGQLALGGVAPTVVLAGELAAGPAGLVTGVVVPDELVAAVPADVVEDVDLTVGAPDDHQRGPGRVELLGEVAPVAGELLHPADVQPGAGEDGLALELVVIGRDRVLVGHRSRAELGVVLGPAALGGLREMRHVVPPGPVWTPR